MNLRTGLPALAALVAVSLLTPGCVRTGLSVLPPDIDGTGGLRTGLDPTPENVKQGDGTSTGLDPFPEDRSARRAKGIGLDPFPYRGQPVPSSAPPAPRPAAGEDEAPVVSVTMAPAAPPPGATAPVAKAPEPAPAPAPAARIELKFVKGATAKYRSDINTTMRSPMFGEEGMTMNMGFNLRQEVKDIGEGGSGIVETTFESMSMKMANPMMGEFSVDTRDPASVESARENPMLGQMVDGLTRMIGKTTRMTLGPRGDVLEMEDMTELMGGMGGMGGGDMSSAMSGIQGQFPDRALEKGMTWEFTHSNESPLGTMTIAGTMTVIAWDEAAGMATIEMVGKLDIVKPEEVDESDMQAQMAAMMEFKGGGIKGTTLFDVRKGRLVSNNSVMKMTMDNPMMGGELETEAVTEFRLVE